MKLYAINILPVLVKGQTPQAIALKVFALSPTLLSTQYRAEPSLPCNVHFMTASGDENKSCGELHLHRGLCISCAVSTLGLPSSGEPVWLWFSPHCVLCQVSPSRFLLPSVLPAAWVLFPPASAVCCSSLLSTYTFSCCLTFVKPLPLCVIYCLFAKQLESCWTVDDSSYLTVTVCYVSCL